MTLYREVADYFQGCEDCQKSTHQSSRAPYQLWMNHWGYCGTLAKKPCRQSLCVTQYSEAIPPKTEWIAEELLKVFSSLDIPNIIQAWWNGRWQHRWIITTLFLLIGKYLMSLDFCGRGPQLSQSPLFSSYTCDHLLKALSGSGIRSSPRSIHV